MDFMLWIWSYLICGLATSMVAARWLTRSEWRNGDAQKLTGLAVVLWPFLVAFWIVCLWLILLEWIGQVGKEK